MRILVERDVSTDRSLTSKVSVAKGEDPMQRYCFGLEPFWDPTETVKPRAIGPGTFDVEIMFSQKHQRRLPVIMNVPGFVAVEIHWGNYEFVHQDAHGNWHPPDSEACLVVGSQRGVDMVLQSMTCFEALFEMIDTALHNGESVTITYVNSWLQN